MNTGLAVGGAILFGVSYAVGIGYAASNGFSSGLGAVAVPLVGPFIAMGSRNLGCEVPPIGLGVDPGAEVEACQQQLVSEGAALAALAGIGVAEVLGGGLFLIGLLDRDEAWVRLDVSGETLAVAPVLRPGGFEIRGTF